MSPRLDEFELRLAPSDKLFLKVGESIRESEPIGEHDMQSDLEKLEERHRYEIEELLAETNEARRQQALVESDIELAEQKRQDFEKDYLLLLPDPEIFLVELRQRKARLEQQGLEVEREKRRFQALEARISELERRIQVKTEQHESDVGRRQREARILAPFTGKILRIDREPAGQSIRYLIFYQ